MTETIAFPDAENVVTTWLTAQFADRGEPATVSTAAPTDGPGRHVRIRRLGGVRRNLVQDQATISVDCWDDDEGDGTGFAGASGLAALTRAQLSAFDGNTAAGSYCYRVTEIGGPYNNPDPTTNGPRYTFSVQVMLRGKAI